MADMEQLRRLVRYNQWADERILDAVESVPPAELGRPREAYFGTIEANLRHTLIAQRVWLARWTGATPRYDEPLAAPWRPAYADTHRALERYVDSQGNRREIVLAQAITHLVNHGTAHRAETGLLLERLGRSPGDLDYSLYCHLHR